MLIIADFKEMYLLASCKYISTNPNALMHPATKWHIVKFLGRCTSGYGTAVCEEYLALV